MRENSGDIAALQAGLKQRKPAPWSVREVTRAIDKFPLRLQEIGRAGVQ